MNFLTKSDRLVMDSLLDWRTSREWGDIVVGNNLKSLLIFTAAETVTMHVDRSYYVLQQLNAFASPSP